MEYIPVGLFVVLFSGLGWLAVAAFRERAQNIAAAQERLRGVVAQLPGATLREDGAGGTWTQDALVVEFERASLGGKQQVPGWNARVRAPRLGERTSLVIVRHQYTPDGLARALGLQDVKVGAPAFDDTFVVRASDEDAARAALQDDRVQAAVRAVLTRARDELVGVRLDLDGDLHVTVPTEQEELVDLRRLLDEVAALARALDVVTARPALPAHDGGDAVPAADSVGAASGAPVAVGR